MPFFHTDLKSLDRCKKQEYYCKHKKSEKQKCSELFKKRSKIYFDQTIQDLVNAKPGKAYSILKRLGSRPGECESEDFNIASHVELELSPQQSADRIAEHFAAVSQEFEPLHESRLPLRVQNKLSQPVLPEDLPQISERDV